jgi:hypothetical protein
MTMKKFLVFLLVASTGFGAISAESVYKLNKKMGQVASEVQLGTIVDQGGVAGLSKDGIAPHKVIQGTYDVAVNGGSAGTHELGISVPDNAIITRSFLDVLTRPAHASGSAGGSLAVTVNSSGDVLAVKHAGTFSVALLEGLQTGAVSAAIKTTAVRPLKVLVTGDTLTAGKVKVYLEYVVSE